jgi:hypothetical protein
VASLVLVLASCAGVPGRSAEEVVKERSQARWNALIAGEFAKAYSFASPGSKQVTPEIDYEKKLRRGFWKSAKVDKVECKTDESCDVSLTIEYEFKGMRTTTPLKETWVREGNEWWYVLR